MVSTKPLQHSEKKLNLPSKVDVKSNPNDFEEPDLHKDDIARKEMEGSECADVVLPITKKKKKSKETVNATGNEKPKVSNGAMNISDERVKEVEKPESHKSSKEKKNKKKLVSESLDVSTHEKESETYHDSTDNAAYEPHLEESVKISKNKKKNKLIPKKNVREGETEASSEIIEDKASVKITSEDKNIKSKDKKKKKNEMDSESLIISGGNGKNNSIKDNAPVLEEHVNTVEKVSKKRKRLASEKSESRPDGEDLSKGANSSKVEVSEKDNGTNGKAGTKENGEVDNENHDNSGTAQKRIKKQHNGSAEPKTVNAFQRVKIDEVEFADERLQDNSYWAKSGADSGYGAKAQEVLGQVRGRDFRHEKTKKKRGSYRGGQIDFDTHSVKFNYSDEE
ncbi:hypothetical protein GIB67_034736 [Kingdonia uniflora]|uniref:Srp40 C-terminal domain-containing protein n=1 Tax=Kingdonia uniflora TaxID=39325 RepID=A0A7J7ML82_9MAGN|nr:hypothetical protein GIB67_034736 [Kingdonia uniflora]